MPKEHTLTTWPATGRSTSHGGVSSRRKFVGITNVARRTNGALTVRGIASSDRGQGNQAPGYGQRYGDNDGYGQGSARYQSVGMDYRFTCKINARGTVTSLNLDRGTRSLRG